VRSLLRALARPDRQRGQGLIEFVTILPLFAVLLLGVLELGTAFSHHTSLEYATREGARSGAALANGGGSLGCGAGQSPKASTVDPLIIEAVERVLTSPGSPIVLSNVNEIRIYKSNATGGEAGPANSWIYSPGTGPVPADNPDPLDFKPNGVQSWSACSRVNTNPADRLGVSISYTYKFTTGLTQVLSFIGVTTGPTWTLTDRTVMNLNPTAQ
jgi:hypothetical protein